VNGTWHDVAIFGLLESEFEASAAG
jgi:hypothetical protein